MELKTFMIILALVVAMYAGVLLAVVADLWSGLRKARRENIPRTSRALRRTVDKLHKCCYNIKMNQNTKKGEVL